MRDNVNERIKNIVLGLLVFMFLPTVIEAQKRMGPKEIEYQIKPVHGLNSEYAEFSPVWYKQQLVFASDREFDLHSMGEGNWSKVKYINLFATTVESRANDSIVFKKAKLFDENLLSDDHVGPVCFSADGKEAIFSQVSHKKQKVFGKVQYRPNLYSAKLVDGKWKEIEKLSFVKVNYSYSHPVLTSDGKKLYFASDAIGSMGGKDIFVSNRTNEGWSEPVSVKEINSTADEVFPSLSGTKLYFSSNRDGGVGALDLYFSEHSENDNVWSEPVTLGPTINSPQDDFSVVFNPNKESGYFSSSRNGNDDIFYFNQIEKVTLYDEDVIAGKFTYRKLKDGDPGGLEVQMLDDEGNVIYRTTTDKNGEFVFKKLPTDGKYTLRLINDGEEVELTLYGKDSDTYLISDENGSFVYRRLNSTDVGTLSLMDTEDVDVDLKEGKLNGQFVYRKLKGENPGGLDVYLVDDEGNIVMRTKTDEYGNFEFKKLPMDKSYTIKIEETDEEIDLVLYNKYDDVTAMLGKDKNGSFIYRKLKSDYSSRLDMLEDTTNLEFSERTMAISGVFKYRELNSFPENMEFEILDGDGNFLMRGKTDGKGYFNYTKLPVREEIMFKLDEESVYFKQKIELEIVSRSMDVVINLDKDEKGFFTYRRLNADADVMKTIEIGDDGTLTIVERAKVDSVESYKALLAEVSTVYYNRGDDELTDHDKEIIDGIIEKLNEYSNLKVKLDAYASSRGDEKLNMKLSQKRVEGVRKYILKKGISTSRIISKAHGEASEDNRCNGDEECMEAMYRLNRKTEIKLEE